MKAGNEMTGRGSSPAIFNLIAVNGDKRVHRRYVQGQIVNGTEVKNFGSAFDLFEKEANKRGIK